MRESKPSEWISNLDLGSLSFGHCWYFGEVGLIGGFQVQKQISGFHNQNLCENLNRTSFARTSWFLVKVHIKANSYRITLFKQFRILKWRNRPQNQNLRKKIKQDRFFLKILTFSQDLCKSQLSGNWTVYTISESQTKKKIPKLECTRKTEWIRPLLKIFTFWSKSKIHLVKAFPFILLFFYFFYFFTSGSDQVRFPSRFGSNQGSGGWHHPWRHA